MEWGKKVVSSMMLPEPCALVAWAEQYVFVAIRCDRFVPIMVGVHGPKMR